MTISVTLNGDVKGSHNAASRLDRSRNRFLSFSFWFLIYILCTFYFVASLGCTVQSSKIEESSLDFPESQIQTEKSGLSQNDFTEKIALLPFENFSDDKNAVTFVMPLLRTYLEKMGFEVLDEESMNRFLLRERVRSTGYVLTDISMKMGKELGVDAILVGSINSFSAGDNPSVGFSARLIDSSDGSIVWADHASATGEDFTGILGIGTVKTIDELIPIVIDKLLDSFSIIPPYKDKESTYRIAVMPFQNKSKHKDAGMIATYMFINELFKDRKFEPLSYGDVRHLVVDLRVRSKGEIDYRNTDAISESSKVDGIVVGTVEHYSEEVATVSPEVVISARLINTHNDKILWYDGYRYNGDEGIFIFDWGKLRSAEQVAYKVVSELVKEMSRAQWE